MAIIAIALAGCSQNKTTQERIGVYDSRAVAVAYAGSVAQANKMSDLKTQMNRARATGDTRTMARLEKEGQAWQSKLNQQGFGTAPVDDLLADIANNLPAIQEAASGTNLISKWNKTELDKHPHAAPVDVTMRLVDAFQPNETQRQRAIEIQKMKPQQIKE